MSVPRYGSNSGDSRLRPVSGRAGQGFAEYIVVLAVGLLVLVTPFPSGTAPAACANKTPTAIGCVLDSMKGAYEGYAFAVTRPVYMEVDPCIADPAACASQWAASAGNTLMDVAVNAITNAITDEGGDLLRQALANKGVPDGVTTDVEQLMTDMVGDFTLEDFVFNIADMLSPF